MPKRRTVLLASAEPAAARRLARTLADLGFRSVGVAREGAEAVDLAARDRPDVALVDADLPGEPDGIAACAIIQRELELPVVLVAPAGRADLLGRVETAGSCCVLVRPLRKAQLKATLGVALRRKAEADVRRHEELLDLLSEAVIFRDMDGRVTFWSRGAETVYGFGREEALGRNLHKLLATRFPKRLSDIRGELAATGRFTGELAHRRKDGERVTVESRWAVRRNRDGTPAGVLQVEQDVSARKRAEQLAVLDARRLSTMEALGRMADSGVERMAAFALEGAVQLTRSTVGFINGIAEDGKSFVALCRAGSSLGRCAVEGDPSHFPLENAGWWAEAVRTRGPVLVNDYVCPDPAKRGLPPGHIPLRRFLAVPVLDEGRVAAVAAVANKPEDYDKTDAHQLSLLARSMWEHVKRGRANEALRAAKQEAEEASRVKSTFLAGVSHELRTPISGILGMTELCLRIARDPAITDYLLKIRDATGSLLAIVNDLLDLSRIEVGALPLSREPFELGPAVERALAPVVFQARSKGLDFSVDIRPGTPQRLWGDPGRLGQILLNLAGNAVKFTERGSIRVTVEPGPGSSKTEAELLFTVRDTGIGIPRDKQADIFERFYQVDASLTRNHGGTGLGLAICKRLCGMMGGDIGVESAPGRGSAFRFTVRLPLSGAPAEAAPAAAAAESGLEDMSGLSILLAEDNLLSREFIAYTLREQGHAVECAANGLEAIEALGAGSFDIVLMDVQMPELDGEAATRRIREGAAGCDPAIPIVALTAHAVKGFRERFLAVGMDEYLTKPVSPEGLARVIGQVLARRRPAAAPPLGEVLDLKTLDARYERDFLQRMLALFAGQAEGRLSELKGALAGEDLAQVEGLAHSLAGSAGTVRAMRAGRLARRLQKAAAGGDPAETRAAFAKVASEFGRVLAAIRASLPPEPARGN
jgi:PAS domain S-box-containing protein